MSPYLEILIEQAHQLCKEPRLREIIAQNAGLEQGCFLDCTIHPDDQMLLHSLRHHLDVNASFSQYFNVGLQQFRAFMQVWQLLEMDQLQPAVRVLDFACGFGRLLRFLVPTLPTGSIEASEIQANALSFVAEKFAVTTWPSAYVPTEFKPANTFDLVWVASLFSHLPDRLFTAWLARLKDILSQNGVLCFSVHDACLLPLGESMPVEGLKFYGASENENLDNQAYGTTYVTEAYVAGRIRQLFGEGYVYHRIPRALAHEQDLYVVAPVACQRIQLLAGFRYGPWGWVDECRLEESGRLYLRGWAGSLDDVLLGHVEIFIDGVCYLCATGMLREDVAQVFGRPQLAHSGWEFVMPLAVTQGKKVLLEVRARDDSGQTALLYAGFLSV